MNYAKKFNHNNTSNSHKQFSIIYNVNGTALESVENKRDGH